MQLVAGYFELFSLRRQNEQAKSLADRHQHVLQFTGAVANAEGFQSASMALCNELATRTGATRVALGWKKGHQIKVKALSHTEKFDKKQELVVQLQRAMEESFDQEEPTRFDGEGPCSANVTREAKKLSQASAGNIVMCSPLRRRDEIVGVMTMEFPARTKVDEQIEACIAVATEILSPQLFDRHENDRNIFVKVGLSLASVAKMAVGPKHWGVKLIILAILAGIGATFIPMTYRVRAPFQLVAKDRRSICAPYQGVLEDVYFKPGQQVKKGQALAQMRTRDMEMKRSEVMAQLATKKAEAESYSAREDKQADYNVALAEIEGLAAQVKLLEYQIGQASIAAPFDCIMLRGDLFERKGAPVEHGDVLFEVAASHPERSGQIDVEAEIQVNERDIQEVKRVFEQEKAGQIQRDHDGDIASTSDPSEEFKVVLQRIVPAGQPAEGENVFSVFAEVKNAAPWLVPGFAGEARVNIEKRTVLWIYTHRLVDWLKLKLWI
jgi:multidrug efflux pump subunit AcrA (membrane-fusion protein)